MTGYQRLATDRGMTVDGDLLADCIAEACPDVLTVEASREVAERALRIAHASGMTILRGSGSRPWTPPTIAAETPDPMRCPCGHQLADHRRSHQFSIGHTGLSACERCGCNRFGDRGAQP